MAAPARTSDLVRDSELRTTFSPGLTHHVYYFSRPDSQRRRERADETWARRQELGNGTFGSVWLEHCESGSKQGQLRAVKEIRKEAVSSVADFYQLEIEAMAKFSHDNYVHCFVQFFGWYQNHDKIFIAMEYIKHGDLQKYLDIPFPEIEARQITIQLAEGLNYLHRNNFAHRDLKPLNILVVHPRPEWWVKISDFGISKRAFDTALRSHVGTPGYIAPEVMGFLRPPKKDFGSPDRNLGTYDLSIDIWALGTIAFHMLAQSSPFPAPYDLCAYVVHNAPFPTQILEEKNVSRECFDFLEKVMAALPFNRLKANEVVAHPWLKTSRSSSQTSLHSNNSIPTFPNTSSMTRNTRISALNAEGSVEWSTMNVSETPEQPRVVHTESDNVYTQYSRDVHRISPVEIDTELKSKTRRAQASKSKTNAMDRIIFNSRGQNYQSSSDFASARHTYSPNKPDDASNLVDEVEGISPEVLARLSFKNIEDLAPRILEVARQIQQDTDVIEKGRISRDLQGQEDQRYLVRKLRKINSNTTAETIKSYIAHGAIVRKGDWAMAIQSALDSKNEECLIALLQCGAELDGHVYFETKGSFEFMSPLTFATACGNELGVWALVSAGANVNPHDKNPQRIRTPLVEAIMRRHMNIARFLLANGADPNATGYTDLLARGDTSVGFRLPDYVEFIPLMAALFIRQLSAFDSFRSVRRSDGVDRVSHLRQDDEENMGMANLLIQAGARWTDQPFSRPHLNDINGRHRPIQSNTFQMAAWLGQDSLLTWLASKAPKDWHRRANALNYAVIKENWKCLDILNKPPYRAEDNLHNLISGYMFQKYSPKEMSWPAFSHAIKKLMKAGFNPMREVHFRYRSRKWRHWLKGANGWVTEELSATELVDRQRIKAVVCDRDKIAALLKRGGVMGES